MESIATWNPDRQEWETDQTDLFLRAAGAVLGDLASLGFDAEWTTVSAASVGAPHLRKRVFIFAWPTDSPGIGYGHPWEAIREGMASAAVRGVVRPAGDGVAEPGLLPTPRATRGGSSTETAALLPTPAARLADKRGMPSVDTATTRMYEEGRRNLEDAVAPLPTPAARVAGRGAGWGDQPGRPLSETVMRLAPLDPTSGGSSSDLMLPSAVMLLPTPTVADSRGTRNATAGRANPLEATNHDGWTLSDVAHADRWGQYAPAIARWEQALNRPAPDPTEPGKHGQPRLSARFVEWLMGLPDGWVTAVPGLSRNDQLRLLGNGVVPLHLAHAVRPLAAHHPAEAMR